MPIAPIMVSRSAIVTRKLCEMKRYRAYHELHPDMPATDQVGGMAPTKDASGTAKLRGTWFHGCMERLIRGDDWESYLNTEINAPMIAAMLTGDDAQAAMMKEQITLIRRAVIGWKEQRGHILNDFTPVSAEEEWTWSMHPLVGQTLRLDQIWRRKSDNQLLIVDFKTMSRPDANWINRLKDSDQTHLYIQALTERTQEPVLGMQYEGIILGKFEDGVQKSPFVRAWQGSLGWSPTWKPGKKMEPLQMVDHEWLDWAKLTGILPDLYCTTGPLSPPSSQLLQTRDATVNAEITWADKIARIEANPSLLPTLVERSPDACLKYGAGYACPYVDLCWHGAQPDLDTFTPRIDHHATTTTNE